MPNESSDSDFKLREAQIDLWATTTRILKTADELREKRQRLVELLKREPDASDDSQ